MIKDSWTKRLRLHEEVSDSWTRHVVKKEGGDRHAEASFQPFTSERVEEIAAEIDSDDGCSEYPSPAAAFEPAHAGEEQGRREKEKRESDARAERSKLLVSDRVQFPGFVEDCSRVEQRQAGVSSHH